MQSLVTQSEGVECDVAEGAVGGGEGADKDGHDSVGVEVGDLDLGVGGVLELMLLDGEHRVDEREEEARVVEGTTRAAGVGDRCHRRRSGVIIGRRFRQ